jgi:hypothetical protein
MGDQARLVYHAMNDLRIGFGCLGAGIRVAS